MALLQDLRQYTILLDIGSTLNRRLFRRGCRYVRAFDNTYSCPGVKLVPHEQAKGLELA